MLVLTHSISFLNILKYYFSSKQFTVSCCNSIDVAYSLLEKYDFELLLTFTTSQLTPQVLELIQYAHQNRYYTKVFSLAELLTPESRLRFFKSGADDVMQFPFEKEEFLLRAERLLLYQKERELQKIMFGKLTLIPQQGLVLADEKRVPLRKREFQILQCLLRFANRVVTREMMIDTLWGENIPMYSTIDSYIRRLRLLLGSELLQIKTIRGFGYMAVPIKVLDLQGERYPTPLNKALVKVDNNEPHGTSPLKLSLSDAN